MQWAMAWMKHEAPPKELPGFMYMLAGGTDASNTDPFAPKDEARRLDQDRAACHDRRRRRQLSTTRYPKSADPDTSVPYVMWAGTPVPAPDGADPLTRSSATPSCRAKGWCAGWSTFAARWSPPNLSMRE